MSDSLLKGTARGGASRGLRWGVPVAMVACVLVLLLVSISALATGIGVSLIGGSVVVVFAGWFARLGDDSERIREQQARERYVETGRWPDDDESRPGPGGADPRP